MSYDEYQGGGLRSISLFGIFVGAAAVVERLEAEVASTGDEVLLDMPISIYGGG